MATSLIFKRRLKSELENEPIQEGSLILLTDTNELYYDSAEEHIRIIDSGTLIYEISESVTFPSASASTATTAALGVAVLGKMVLGQK